jgi:hypothetical protein
MRDKGGVKCLDLGACSRKEDKHLKRVILYNWCGWGNVSSFDNVSLKTATGSNLVYNGGFAVPEPITMAVLGLGSLWLVRKK